MNRLEKRKIEVEAIKPLLAKLETLMPFSEVNKLLKEINESEAYNRGKDLAFIRQTNTIESLHNDVNTWGDGDEMEIDIIEKSKKKLIFNVTKCPYHKLYKMLGMEKYGVAFSCCRDEPFAKGLNKNLKLHRTKTLMEGDDYCDFRYILTNDN